MWLERHVHVLVNGHVLIVQIYIHLLVDENIYIFLDSQGVLIKLSSRSITCLFLEKILTLLKTTHLYIY